MSVQTCPDRAVIAFSPAMEAGFRLAFARASGRHPGARRCIETVPDAHDIVRLLRLLEWFSHHCRGGRTGGCEFDRSADTWRHLFPVDPFKSEPGKVLLCSGRQEIHRRGAEVTGKPNGRVR